LQDGDAAAKKCKQRQQNATSKLVDQLSLGGDFIARHESMTAAAASSKVARSTMYDAIHGSRVCANHLWRYVDGNGEGKGVEMPMKTPTKHDVVSSNGKHPSVKDVNCSHSKEGAERSDGSEGGDAAEGSDRRGEQVRRSGASASGCDADSFDSLTTPKDQGWGQLLESRWVKPGDTIRPPGRGENKDRRALVQDDGTLLEEDASTTWIDPVAFCVSSNDWKESVTFLKDRNRIGHCTRVRGDEEVKLSELKIKARKSLEGDKRAPSSAAPENLKPAIGARVQVRFDVDGKGTIKWLEAKLTDFDNSTREWKIKLDVCVCVPSQTECNGCHECVFQLESSTRDW